MRIALRGLPVLACGVPHRHFAGREFPLWLLDALVDGEIPKIPAGETKGLLFRKHVCGGCGAQLALPGEERRTFSFSLAWKQTPAFTVDVTVPLYRCAGCGREQAGSREELAKLAPNALVHAFKAAGLKGPAKWPAGASRRAARRARGRSRAAVGAWRDCPTLHARRRGLNSGHPPPGTASWKSPKASPARCAKCR
jgi:hypothetical protein